MRLGVALAAAGAVAACATAPNAPINAPLSAHNRAQEHLGVEGDALFLSFSGGGARAAAFSHGVLRGLHEMAGADGAPLTQRIVLITAVSGGAITAAHYGLHGDAGLASFRADALDKDWAGDLNTSPASPLNWLRAWRGGINGPKQLAGWLDREVFHDARIGDFRGPRILINATELYTGAAFAFAPPYFDAVCADLAGVRVADAVAASMSVPVAFRPIAIETRTDCAPLPAWVEDVSEDRAAPVLVRETARAFAAYRDAARMRYLHLADGGIVDNFGLTSLMVLRHADSPPLGPLSARDAVRLRRLTILVVNAELDPAGDWALDARGPGVADVANAALGASINAGKRGAYDAFAATLDDWREELISFRCGLSDEDVLRLRGTRDAWDCRDLAITLDMISFADLSPDQHARLGAAPTRVSLPAELIDDLIEGGRTAVRANAAAQAIAR